jgi:FkbM family methyltransferase
MASLAKRVTNRAVRELRHALRLRRARAMGLEFRKPNYLFFDRFDGASVVIDVGCGYDADFSVAMLEKANVTAFAVDPTRKHAPALRALEERFAGRFKHFPFAITATDGRLTFYESAQNVSGSVLADHTNVLRDTVRSYAVDSVSINRLLPRLGITRAAYLKLDLEGAEYDVLAAIDDRTLASIDQMLVEFHHHCIGHYSSEDTRRAVDAVARKGLRHFSLDDHNYLFFRP